MPETPESEGRKSAWDRFALPVIVGVSTSLIVAAIVALVRDLTSTPPAGVNIVLVLDTSAEMNERFGKGTRFDAAVGELIDFVEPRDADNLALWTSGGSCGSDAAKEVVPFGPQNSDRIQGALQELEPRGASNLGDAIIRATGAFSDPQRFPAESRKNVFVFTAGRDTCDADYVDEIESRLMEVGGELNVRLHFFALRAPARLKRDLRALEQELPNQVATSFSDTPAELSEDTFDIVSEIDPDATPTPGPSTSSTPMPAPSPS